MAKDYNPYAGDYYGWTDDKGYAYYADQKNKVWTLTDQGWLPLDQVTGGGGGGGGSSGGGGGSSSGGSGGGGSGGGSSGPKYFLTSDAGQHLTKDQYDAIAVSYRQYGSIYGYNLTDSMIRNLIQGDVGATETQERLSVVQQVQTNATLMRDYSNWLTSVGKKNDLSTEKGQLAFFTGQSSPDFYNTWNQIATEASFQEAGVTVGGVSAVGKKVATNKDLTLTMPEITDFESILGLSPTNPADYQALSQFSSQYAYLALTEMSESRFQSAGLTHTDLAHIIDNSADAQTQDKFNRLVQTHQDFFQRQRASTGTTSTTGGGTAPAGTLAGISG